MIETAILSPLVTEQIIGSDGRFVMLHQPFIFQSQVLYRNGLKYICGADAGFVYDLESIPWFRGSSPVGGTAHDILCRIDSDPQVTKYIAAKVYLELACYEYGINGGTYPERFKAWAKYGVVVVWPGYFHRHKMNATYKEMAGICG